jgi:tripartite-type tricarboxylate transporter receptor subunit TctC
LRAATIIPAVILANLAGAQSAAQSTQNYPVKPIHWIVPFAPGGPTDIMSRAIGERLTQQWGQQIVVENKGGAGGNIGAELTAKSAPDGYTVMIGHVGTHAINVTLYPRIAFDPVRDFSPITLIATLPLGLVVHQSMPAKSVSELVTLARSRPNQISFASAGNGGPTHLAGELFKKTAKIDIVHVPYKGNAAALTDLIGGHVHMMFSNFLTAMPHVKTGKLRAIGVSTAKRSAQAPDLPTVAESGLPGFDVTPWYGILGPAGMPRAIVMKWNQEVARIVALPEMQQRFVGQGVDLISSTPEQFGQLIRTEIPKWAKVVRESGAKVD